MVRLIDLNICSSKRVVLRNTLRYFESCYRHPLSKGDNNIHKGSVLFCLYCHLNLTVFYLILEAVVFCLATWAFMIARDVWMYSHTALVKLEVFERYEHGVKKDMFTRVLSHFFYVRKLSPLINAPYKQYFSLVFCLRWDQKSI